MLAYVLGRPRPRFSNSRIRLAWVIAFGRLGHVLFWNEFDKAECLSWLEIRQLAFPFPVVLIYFVGSQKPRVQQRAPDTPKQIGRARFARCRHVHRCDAVQSRLHLRGDEAPPDDLIQRRLVGGKYFPQQFGRARQSR